MLAVLLALAPVAPARPPNGQYETFRVKTDNTPQAEIEGWSLPARGPGRAKGTVFVLHGYNNSKERMVGWEWIRDQEGWNVVMFDFREHGNSTRTVHLCTLGYYEIWDVKAAVDWAERRGLARPFVIYGRSMGASTGLRWAASDKRIDGVLAVSPFRNAELATRQIAQYSARVASDPELGASYAAVSKIPTPVRNWIGRFAGNHNLAEHPYLLPGYREMLEQVDIPTDVGKRSDLRVWVMSGDNDAFPPEDERAIVAGSASPARLKRLVIVPGGNHRSVLFFAGAEGLPSHDQYIREFLAATLADPASGPAPGVGLRGASGVAVGVIAGVLFLALLAMGRFFRQARRAFADPVIEPARLPPPTDGLD